MRSKGSTPSIPLPKIKKNESLKSFFLGDELLKWLKLVLTNVEFVRLLPVLSSCLSMEQIDVLKYVKGAEKVNVKKEEDMAEDMIEDDTKEEIIPMYPEATPGQGPNEESYKEDDEEAAKNSIDDLEEIINVMQYPEKVPSRVEPKTNWDKQSSVTKRRTQTLTPWVQDCKECSMVFETRGAKKYHMEAIHSDRTFECATCQKQFPTRGNLNKHSIVHQDVGQFVCTTCGKVFLRKQALNDHARTHTGERPFPCPDCPYRGSSSSLLACHKRSRHMKHSEKVPSMADPKQNRLKQSSVSKSRLQTRRSVGRPRVVQECKECSLVFNSRYKKKYHMETIHSDCTFECATCQKQFTNRRNLTKHSVIHQDVGEQFLCNACGKEFKRKTTLIEHTRIHTGEKPFLCLKCPYQGSSSSLLAHHKKRTHKI